MGERQERITPRAIDRESFCLPPDPTAYSDPDIFDRAWEIHMRTCATWPMHRIRGVAYPFGRPAAMPRHHWRVSWDVMQALWNASPLPWPATNPKATDGYHNTLLFGWRVERDDSAPAGTMVLEMDSETR